MSAPSNRTVPLSLSRLPEIWPINVVLPAPFGPIKACTSPAFTSRVTSSVATTPPKRFETPFSSSMAPPREQACDALRREQHRSEEHTSELQSLAYLVCRLLLE